MRFSPLFPLLAIAVAVPARPASAQASRQDGGVVTGFVIDAATGSPLANATVAVEASGDVTVVQPTGSGAFLSRGASTTTGPDGGYRFSGLTSGSYRLHVKHLGYREAVIEVDLAPSAPFRVSVGLVVSPIRLEPMGVASAAGQAFGRTRTSLEEAQFGRMDAEVLRGDLFLESDARVLTQSDVTEAVTLGEGDLLRALQRLPGVSARDDYTAGLWTRGAPWGQTRAYYDGLPLFNPVHAFGLLSSLNPDAIGVASFHPGVRSSAIGEGAAGVLALTSRSADRPGIHGLAEVSVTSARATVDVRSPDGSQGLVFGARRSYVDAATRLAQIAGGDSTFYLPYSFLDLTLRADQRFGSRTGLQVSGLWAEDNINGGLRDLLQRTRGAWGNRLGQASLEHRGDRIRTRTSVGVSRFAGSINPPAPVPMRDAVVSVAASDLTRPRPAQPHASTNNGLTVLTGSADVAQGGGSGRPAWSAGAQLTAYRQSFSGQYPRPYPVVLPTRDTLFVDESLLVPALWGEHRLTLNQFALETGIRLEAPTQIWGAPGVTAAPRVSARYTLGGGRAALSAGAARSWQYTQALAPAGPSVGPDLYLTDVWLLSGDTIPAIRADIATVGGEVSFGSGWVGGFTGYYRYSTGIASPFPDPGAITDDRPIFVPGVNRAIGVELGVRRIIGRLTASTSYALARSMMTSAGWTFPSPADRRHVIDATAMYRVTPGFRVGAALTGASGSPFSRYFLKETCDSLGTCATTADSLGLPMAERTPVYAALDFLMDWEGSLGGARVGAFIQVRNLLNRGNAVTYVGSYGACQPAPPGRRDAGSDETVSRCDEFARGIPLLPLAGVRIAF